MDSIPFLERWGRKFKTNLHKNSKIYYFLLFISNNNLNFKKYLKTFEIKITVTFLLIKRKQQLTSCGCVFISN